MIFAVFDPSPLTVCIHCSILHLYLLFYYQFRVGYMGFYPYDTVDVSRTTLFISCLKWIVTVPAGQVSNCSDRQMYVIVANFMPIDQTVAEIMAIF